MKRREFITLLGGAAATWPAAARAQQSALPVIGYLYGGSARPPAAEFAAFHKGLDEAGYVEGRNVALELRGTDQYDRFPALAAEFARQRVAVIVATGAINGVQAAIAATTTIPIVFGNGADPVRMGLVASINRPGGNATGVSYYTAALGVKRLEILRELVPSATTIAFLANTSSTRTDDDRHDMEAAARSVGQQMIILGASTEQEIDTAFAMVVQERVAALLVSSDAFFNGRAGQLAALAARYKIPASYAGRNYVVAGGLMSYGDDRQESYRQIGIYTGRILRGEKPADLPVVQPTKFEFVINRKTATALGVTFPPSFELRATEVIE